MNNFLPILENHLFDRRNLLDAADDNNNQKIKIKNKKKLSH